MGVTPDCIAAVRSASGDKLTDQDAADLIRRMEDLRKLEEARGNVDNLDARLRALAAAEAEKAKIAAALELRNRAANILKLEKAKDHLNALTSAGMRHDHAWLTWLEGRNSPLAGTRDSIAKATQGYLGRYMQDFNRFMLRHPEIARLVEKGDKAFAADVVREMYELHPNGQPGRTGNKDAQLLAVNYADWANRTRIDLNDHGAMIGRLEAWSPQSHSSPLVRRVSPDEWIDFIQPELSSARSFDGMNETMQRNMLRDIYESVTTGVDRNGIGAEVTGRITPANLSTRLSHARVLHFKDADAHIRYAERFTEGNVHDAMLGHFTRAAKLAAQMEHLGTNPANALTQLQAFMYRTATPDIREKFKPGTRLNAIASSIAEVQGLSAQPERARVAEIATQIRAWQSLSKLTGAVLSSASDLVTRAAALTNQGKPIMAAWNDNLKELFRGRGNAEQRDIAAILNAGMDGMKGHITAAGLAEDMPLGTTHKLLNWFFKWQGMQWWSDMSKAGGSRMLSHEMAIHRESAFDQLQPRYRRILQMHNITADQWNAIRSTAWQAESGDWYITPDRIEALPRQTLIDLARPDLEAMQKGLADRIAKRQANDAKEAEWMARRAEAFRNSTMLMVARLQKRNAQGEATAADRVAGMRDRMGELQLRLDELAEFHQAVADGRAWQEAAPDPAAPRSSNTIRSTAGTEGGRVFDPRAERYLDEGAPETLAARAEGELRARLDALRRTIGAINREATQAEKGRLQEFGDWWNRRQVELDQFTARMEARAEARAADTKAEADTYGDQVDRILARTQRSLEVRLRGFFADELGFAFIETDARTRRQMYQGTSAGTITGEIYRFITQFKAYPIAFTNRVLGRSLYSYTPDERLLQTKNLGALIGGMIVMGYLSMTAKDFVKGYGPRDPEKPATWLAALAQSGGAGIYGDFLFAQSNRFGNAPAEALLGPTGATAARFISLSQLTRDGDAKLGDWINFALQNTPIINMWYAKPALDLLILNSLREAYAPGFIARQQERNRKDFGQERIMPATAF
jgi:hypothetical protein